MKKYTTLVLALFIISIATMPIALADLDDEISEEDQEAFDEILTPVMKIYNFVKYSATTLAALFMVFSAVSFMTAGEDQRKREGAKKSISYTILGLIVIWAVPYAITFLVG